MYVSTMHYAKSIHKKYYGFIDNDVSVCAVSTGILTETLGLRAKMPECLPLVVTTRLVKENSFSASEALI